MTQQLQILVKSIQHQIQYHFSKIHFKTTDFEEIKHLSFNELKTHPLVYKTYNALQFSSKGGKDVNGLNDEEMRISKQIGTYTSKEYCPLGFALIRKYFKVSIEDCIQSICSENNLPIPSSGAGKSGSLFMFTKDKKYIIKTIPKGEEKVLVKWLSVYFNHLLDNPSSLLPQYYGMFRIKIGNGKEYRYIITNNLFSNTHYPISTLYDVKGSYYHRKASDTERMKSVPCLKDEDFMNDEMKLHIDSTLRQHFIEQIEKDSHMLRDCNLMDYSLLIGIHQLSDKKIKSINKKLNKEKKAKKKEQKDSHEKELKKSFNKQQKEIVTLEDFISSIEIPNENSNQFIDYKGGLLGKDSEGNLTGELYYLGIIDILLPYTTKKKIANICKTIVAGSQDGLSSVPSDFYSERFIRFIQDHIE